jgi:hypothetical protein
MTTLNELKDRILESLGDSNGTRYDAALLDEALRLALEEYSRALPQLQETVFTVTTAGSSQEISGVKRLLTVIEVLYPFDPNDLIEHLPADPWYAYNKDGSHWLLFGEDAPQVGQQFCVRYAAGHTLAGLDGAESTSLPQADESLLAQGAAGHAAIMRSAGMLQAFGKRNPQDESLSLGRLRLESFRKHLDDRKDHGLPGLLTRPWTARWVLDGWDGV